LVNHRLLGSWRF